uniref:Uncharacterized protein n=1 Tax=Cacopsylla melanoneura TaxID=428564 RepID=A0A8D9FEX5_9HEMI
MFYKFSLCLSISRKRSSRGQNSKMDYKFVFERPTMDGFPKVFKECECKSKTDPNKSVRIKIQEVPEDMHDRLIEFMVKYYLPDEPLSRYVGHPMACHNSHLHMWELCRCVLISS